MRKVLKPIEPKNSWHRQLQADLLAVMQEVFYEPLLENMKEANQNEKTDRLRKALYNGDLLYKDNMFKGKLNASLSKELKALGAKWYAKEAAWVLPLAQMPGDLRQAVKIAELRNKKLVEDFAVTITDIPKRMAERVQKIDFDTHADVLADRIDEAYKETVLNVVSVAPELTPEQAIFVDETYIKSVTRPILVRLKSEMKDNVDKSMLYFSEEEVIKLRKIVADHVYKGRPRSELIKIIQNRLNISKDRAKFIARQETALFTAEFKQAQYESSGIKKYKWRAVGDSRTRPRHKELNGTIQYWNDPPLLEQGRRGHPGEDFNCRCTASPIVEF